MSQTNGEKTKRLRPLEKWQKNHILHGLLSTRLQIEPQHVTRRNGRETKHYFEHAIY